MLYWAMWDPINSTYLTWISIFGEFNLLTGEQAMPPISCKILGKSPRRQLQFSVPPGDDPKLQKDQS